MPAELKARFIAETRDFDEPVARMAKRFNTAMDDIRKTVDSQAAASRASAAEMQAQQQQAIGRGSIPANMMSGVKGAVAGAAAVTAATSAARGLRVAATMWVSALRDTFTSLASGQNPLTILAQQGPQIAQGFQMAGGKILRLGGYIGLAAAAFGAFYLITKKWSELFFNVRYGVNDFITKHLQDRLAFFKKLRQEQLKEAEESKKRAEENQTRLKQNLATHDELAKLRTQSRANEAKDEKEKLRILKEYAEETLAAERRKLEGMRWSRESDEAYTKQEIAVENAKIAIQELNQEMEKLDEKDKKQLSRRHATPDASELQRIGGMPVGDTALVDIGRYQLAELRGIRSDLRQNSRGVFFGR